MSSPDATAANRIVRLVGVYDADSTLRGEVAYWIGARLGRRHCSLCDITHGSFRARPEWNACRTGLPVPFDTYHRNDQPDQVRSAANGQAPVVVAETTAGHVVLVDPVRLNDCGGSLDDLLLAIEHGAAHHGLAWASMNGEAVTQVTVYSRPGCPFCTSLRRGLQQSGTPFTEVNIWEDPAAAAFVRSVARGNETVPTVTVGDVAMVNPSAEKVREVLNAS